MACICRQVGKGNHGSNLCSKHRNMDLLVVTSASLGQLRVPVVLEAFQLHSLTPEILDFLDSLWTSDLDRHI